MTIIKSEKLDISQISTTCDAYLFIIEIDNIADNAKELTQIISDNSWLQGLDFIDKDSFEECAKETLIKILQIFADTVSNNLIKDEFGEYMVSINSQRVLEKQLQHELIPLSEIWGKKKTGNPGFDFHTYDKIHDLITFGEAKYNSNSTPLKTAVDQINRFINESPNKDKIDSRDLKSLKISESAILKIHTNRDRNLAAAFSIVGNVDNFNIDYYLKKDYIRKLLQEKNEIYFIGVIAK